MLVSARFDSLPIHALDLRPPQCGSRNFVAAEDQVCRKRLGNKFLVGRGNSARRETRSALFWKGLIKKELVEKALLEKRFGTKSLVE